MEDEPLNEESKKRDSALLESNNSSTTTSVLTYIRRITPASSLPRNAATTPLFPHLLGTRRVLLQGRDVWGFPALWGMPAKF